ncbi:MAG: hypothetical protein AAGE01_20005 [Pseudomonadota bacterium]
MGRPGIIAVSLLLALGAASAQVEPSAEAASAPAEPVADEEKRSAIDTANETVTNYVISLARWVDEIFDDPNYTEEEADARLEVRLIASDSRENSAEFRARTRFRISLPRLSRRASLVFEGNDDIDINDFADEDFDNAIDDSLDAPALGIQYFRRDDERVNLSWTAGVRASSVSFYIGPRVRYISRLGDDSIVRATQRLRWYTEEGWDSNSRLDFDRRFDNGFFRQLFAVRWREDRYRSEGARVSASTSWTKPLSEESALRYAWTSVYLTESQADGRETRLSVGYRKRFWRDWIAIQVTPFVAWEQRNDWDFNPGLQVSITTAFERERLSNRPDLVTEDFDD